VYFCRAIQHRRRATFLDDSFAEIIINFWKAAEALLGVSKTKEVAAKAKKVGLTEDVSQELTWLWGVRHSHDVAHAVIYRKQSPEKLVALYADRGETVRRANNVVRALIDHVLASQTANAEQDAVEGD
jgi:hypothetical protein